MSAIRRKTARGSDTSSGPATGSDVSAPASSIGDGGSDDPGASQLVRLRILDKEVQLSCQSGEEDELMQAAAYVNRAMLELRQRNTTSSIEKIAIVTAINTASSLLKARHRAGDDDATTEGLARLNRTLDNALTKDADITSPD